jgi:photosystem II stability/assembly factor-like uncharacterized protein
MKPISALLFIVILFVSTEIQAQKKKGNTPTFTSGVERLKNQDQRQKLSETSLFNGIRFRNVGPTVMSGRVVDLAVNPADPTQFYVAYASGGLWVTRNNGTTFTSVFDSEMVMTIGAIAVDWEHGETIWIGTGEVNSSRSSYAGTGIYKSSNKGQDWDYLGLPESHHIGRIVLDPGNPQVAWVAVLGHLYTPNAQRGVYKTTDGGKSWTHSLAISDNTGVVDLAMDPLDANHLFAGAWQRSRSAWNFVEGGKQSGIYESLDGGQKWTCITGGTSGFPQDEGTGRIGLSLYNGSEGLHLYAILDNQNLRPEEDDEKTDELVKGDFKSMSSSAFAALSNTKLQTFLEDNGFPEKYDSTKVKSMINDGSIQPQAIFEFLTDANAALFDRPVIGAEVYSFDSKTRKWKRTHDDYIDDVVFSYGYYFGVITVSPTDPNALYIAGVPLIKSKDGGATWQGITADNVHADHHILWVNPKKPGHLINGNDGGVNISYDDGENYIKCNSPAVGQFYTVNVDYAEPYNVYGGLQDNGVWKGPSTYEASPGWQQEGHYPYESLIGGDGMKVEIDTRDNSTVYTGYQFGHYYRINGDDYHYFHPTHELGERPLRWNWQTPVLISHHNQDIIYMGSNKFHRSMDQAENWETLSGDLTSGGKPGDVPFGTITSIDESPFQFGLIYLGTDDGNLHRSNDGGLTWTSIYGKFKTGLWVSRVVASTHEKSRVYCTLNGYRNDDFKAYVYKSDDMGKTWQAIGTDLPLEPVNVILEDPSDENILYAGTDNGIYISIDGGKHFMTIDSELPPVAVHDIVVQSEAKDLVIGTHGRSIYVASINEVQEVNKLEGDLVLFEVDKVRHSKGWGNAGWSVWFGTDEPETEIPCYYSGSAPVTFTLQTDSGMVVHTWESTLAHKGFNYETYDLTISKESAESLKANREEGNLKEIAVKAADNGKYYIPQGTYTLVMSAGDLKKETEFLVE